MFSSTILIPSSLPTLPSSSSGGLFDYKKGDYKFIELSLSLTNRRAPRSMPCLGASPTTCRCSVRCMSREDAKPTQNSTKSTASPATSCRRGRASSRQLHLGRCRSPTWRSAVGPVSREWVPPRSSRHRRGAAATFDVASGLGRIGFEKSTLPTTGMRPPRLSPADLH